MDSTRDDLVVDNIDLEMDGKSLVSCKAWTVVCAAMTGFKFNGSTSREGDSTTTSCRKRKQSVL